ncbi:hypothetical protein [Streptomyces sp. NPDC090025]|uniref:hypothetical protein n=1 Tax=Streptomyces sp. NPDC090025 TaxID=3365922 RepID=UPI00383400A3
MALDSFAEEWSQAKNTALSGASPDPSGAAASGPGQGQESAMRLNQAPGAGPGSGNTDLATTPEKKKAAAGVIENHIQPDTKAAADAADEGTNGAVTELKGWDTAAGLKQAHEHWDGQVKRLMARFDSEKTSLRSASNLFQGNDIDTRFTFTPVQQSKVSGL